MHKKHIQAKQPRKSSKKSAPKSVRVQRAPVARAAIRRNTEPIFKTGRPGTILVSKTEYIGEVGVSNLPYSIAGTYPINARSAITFPWLSRIAGNFESFSFKRLIFHYETEAPTTSVGYTGLVIDYNPSDAPPSTKLVAMDFSESVRGPLWSRYSHVCGSSNLHKRKSYFCRESTKAPFDPLLFDVGTLYTIGGGAVENGIAGELWVEYECELLTPELDSGNVALDGALKVSDCSISNETATSWDLQCALDVDASKTTGGELYISRGPNHWTFGTIPISESLDTGLTPPPFKQEDFVVRKLATNVGPMGIADMFRFTANSTYIVDLFMDIISGGSHLSNLALNFSVLNGSATVTVLEQMSKIPEGYIAKLEVTTDLLPASLCGSLAVTIAAASAAVYTVTYYIRHVAQRLGETGGIVPTSSLSCFELENRRQQAAAVLQCHRSELPSGRRDVEHTSPPTGFCSPESQTLAQDVSTFSAPKLVSRPGGGYLPFGYGR